MPVYETVDGRGVVDSRTVAEANGQQEQGRVFTTAREAAQQGTLDQMAEAVVREAYGILGDPYIDGLAIQGYRDIGGVGGPGPWAGPIDLDQQTRRQEVQWARTLAAFSPPAKNALRLHRTYVLGQGIPMPTAQDSDVQGVIEDEWDDPDNAELCTHQGQAETDAAWLTTGELYLALHVDEDDGHVKWRSVEPTDIDTVVTHPDDRKRALYYRVRQHRDAFNFAQGQAMDDVVAGAADEYVYYPDWANADPERDPYRGQARPRAPGGAVMASFPLNRQGVRGIPELTAAVPWIQSHKRLLEAQSIMAEAKKKIALVKTVKGGPQAVGSAASLEQSSISADFGRLERNPARAPGSTYVKNKGIELEYPDLGTGADDAQRDAEMHAQMIGAATGWGTHYLLMSTEFHRLATAVTMELPTLKMCLEGQQRWLDMLRSVLDYALLWAAKKGKIDAPVVRKHGREVVDWKRAQPAPAKDDDEKDQQAPAADVRESVAAALESTAGAYESDDEGYVAERYRRAAALVREMEPHDVLAQAKHQDESKQPEHKAKKAQAQRGHYVVDMPPVLQRDLLPTVQAIEAAAQGGHITPEQAARQTMLTMGFGEIDDSLEEWRRFVELHGAQLEKEAQQAQDMTHKDQAIKAGPPGGPAAAAAAAGGAGAGAKPDLPGTQGASAPSGGLSRNPVAREAEAGTSAPPFDDAAGAQAQVREAAGAGHWVTIEEEGIATHIFIQGGRVTKGPAGLIGAQAGHLPPGPNRTVTHHPAGHEPAGARDHPHYAEHQPPAKPEPLPGKPYARLSGAPQTRQEQPDERPEALSPEQAEAGLRAAQEAKREPPVHGLHQGARRADPAVAHALRYHLARRARERGEDGPQAVGEDPIALHGTVSAGLVHRSGGKRSPKDVVYEAGQRLRVAANHARTAGHITETEHERVHELATRAAMFVHEHDRPPSPLEAAEIKREYEAWHAQREDARARQEGVKELYQAHLSGRGKNRPVVSLRAGQAGQAQSAPDEAARTSLSEHLKEALPRPYHALLRAHGTEVLLHGGEHGEVRPGAQLPDYYHEHLRATGQAPDAGPGGVYDPDTKQAHMFGGSLSRAVARHELGHAVDHALGSAHPNAANAPQHHSWRSHEQDFFDIYNEHKDNERLWSYMRRTPRELFAEGFALHHDKTPRSLGWVNGHDRLKKDAPSLHAFFKNLLAKEMGERLAPKD